MTVMADIEHPADSGPLTVHDLEGMPDDGRRRELIDGVLIVSPAPGRRHQKIVVKLYESPRGRVPFRVRRTRRAVRGAPG